MEDLSFAPTTLADVVAHERPPAPATPLSLQAFDATVDLGAATARWMARTGYRVAARTASVATGRGRRGHRQARARSRLRAGVTNHWDTARSNGFSWWSTESRLSVASIRSHQSVLSAWSLWSFGSILSVGGAGSIASIGSVGSVLSIGSAGSVLSIGSAGSVLAIGGRNQRPRWLGAPVETPSAQTNDAASRQDARNSP